MTHRDHADNSSRTLLRAVAGALGLYVLFYGAEYEGFATWSDQVDFARAVAIALVVYVIGRHPDDPAAAVDERARFGLGSARPSFWLVLLGATVLTIAFVILAGPESASTWSLGLVLFAGLVFGRLLVSL